jgi:hypothetical protein
VFIDQFASQNGNKITIGSEQASSFAKTISNDFNPIHDPTSKRFCVPGDLLFAFFVEYYGLFNAMDFVFTGLVSADTTLVFPSNLGEHGHIVDDYGKEYLKVAARGSQVAADGGAEALVRAYVRFSGQNFPHILVPLMAEKNVMINPKRPLIIYQSMSITLDRLDLDSPLLVLMKKELEVKGKRGDAHLHFDIHDNGRQVGHGVKHLILSGLRPYDELTVDAMVEQYLCWQNEHSLV